MTFRFLIFATLLAAFMTGARAETVPWGSLFEMVLPVHSEQELVIQPPANIEVGVPHQISDKIDLLNVPGRLLINTKQEFPAHNIVIKHHKHGSTVIKMSAAQDATPKHYTLVLPQERAAVDSEHPGIAPACQYSYAAVVRSVMQKLYAPKRISRQHNCLQRTSIEELPIHLFSCERSRLCSSGATITPIASWFAQTDLWAHALEVKNNMPHKSALDPRDILYSEDFLAIAFAQSWLDKAGEPADNTVAVLLSKDKLRSSLTDLHRRATEISP